MVLVLAGCSQTPHIHIISHGYSNEELAQLSRSLQELDVQVTINETVMIPAEFEASSLAINPGFYQPHLISEIERLLIAQEFKRPDIYRFAQGKHFYNGHNIGLYLKNPTAINDYAIPRYIRTQYCNAADGVLQLAKNGDFIYEYELLTSSTENDIDSDNDFEVVELIGQWQFDQRFLTLHQQEAVIQRFLFSQGEKQTFFGPKAADIFTPKITSSNQALNCELLIIYGE